MSTTTTPESDDYTRGFRDGIEYMNKLDDEAAAMEFIFGSKTEEDLSIRQLKLARLMCQEHKE